MTPTDRATAYIEAAVADGVLLHGPDVAAEFGIARVTAPPPTAGCPPERGAGAG
jgi:hypothetical protein